MSPTVLLGPGLPDADGIDLCQVDVVVSGPTSIHAE